MKEMSLAYIRGPVNSDSRGGIQMSAMDSAGAAGAMTRDTDAEAAVSRMTEETIGVGNES